MSSGSLYFSGKWSKLSKLSYLYIEGGLWYSVSVVLDVCRVYNYSPCFIPDFDHLDYITRLWILLNHVLTERDLASVDIPV